MSVGTRGAPILATALGITIFLSGPVCADVEQCDAPALPFGGENGTPTMVTTSITVNESLVIQDLQIDVDIAHGWVGDIVLDLVSPSGTSLRLHDSAGGDANDLVLTFSDDGVANGTQPYNSGCLMQPGLGTLSIYDGEPVTGLWALTAIDTYPANDDGVIESWCVRAFDTPPVVLDPCALPSPDLQPALAERLVLVLIDGLRYSEGLGDPTRQHVPNMDAIAQAGSIIEPFLNDGTTTTVHSIPALMNGSWYGSTSFFDPDCQANNQYSNVPYIHEYIRAQLGFSLGDCVYVAGPFCPWRGSFHPAYGPDHWPQWIATAGGDDINWNTALGLLQTTKPRFLTLYLSDVDSAGHSGSWADYLAAIENADAIVGALWNWIQADPDYADRTAMLITNDHGRHDYDFQGHGDGCIGCRQIQCLAVGPGIRSGWVSTTPRTIPDLTPTLARILGADAQLASGEVMTEILVEEIFARGDSNADGEVNISDVIVILLHLFEGASVPCMIALDSNDDDWINIGDAISLLGYLFQAGPPPAPPFPTCGGSVGPAVLDCAVLPPCD